VQANARNELLEKIRSGKWVENQTACPVCGADGGRVIAEIDRYGIPVTTVICKVCSLIRTVNQLRESDYAEFYSSFYRSLYDGALHASPKFVDEQIVRGRRLVRIISRHIDLDGKLVVEVGCGAGGVLRAFQEVGSQVFGCDYGEEYLEAGRRLGLDLVRGGISEIPTGIADVIVYSHVLEHIQDLKGEFDEIRRVLKPAGKLVVEVPGVYKIHRQYAGDILEYLQNAHLYHFTRQTLTLICSKFGFSEVWSNQHVYGVFSPDNDVRPSIRARKDVRLRPYLFLCRLSRHFLRALTQLLIRNTYRGAQS
jgi:SAM-dependent methyltransferase